MKLSEMTNEQKSRWIAEKLEWKNIRLESDAWADVHNQWHSGQVGSKDGTRTMIPDYITDPAMTDLLWKQLIKQLDFETACDKIMELAPETSEDPEDWNGLVVDAWMLYMGYREEG